MGAWMNSTEDVFADELKKRTEEAQAVIERFLPKAEGPAATVIEAMNYSVEAGGKRLRPVLRKAPPSGFPDGSSEDVRRGKGTV